MCGRFTHMFSWQEVWRFSQPLRGAQQELTPSYNVPPKAAIPVIAADQHGPRAALMQWWLVPSWSKELEIKYATFNAKSEEASAKPAFRSPFKYRRCVIPASGFFEWKKLDAKTKQPYYIYRADDEPLFFAGLWDIWKEEFESCTVLTCAANEEMSDVHHRMPCILEPEQLWDWLNPDLQDKSEIQSLIGPAAAGVLTMHMVDRRVGNVRNNDQQCIAQID